MLLVSAADGATRVLKTLQGSGDWPQAARFSRDGQYVAYDWPQEKDSAEHDVFLLSVDGGHETRLVQHPADERLLGWSPDGRGILFSSDRSGSVDMWFLPVTRGKAQGTPELVKSGVERIRPLGFTRDGSFYYGQAQPGCDVYITRMDPQSGRILAPSEKLITRFQGKNSWPAYSPDGKSLAYTTSRGHSLWSVNFPNIVVIHSLETGQEREFATKFQRLFKLRWPLDGRFIYLGAQGMGYYRLDTQTGEFTRILRRESPSTFFLDFDVSPDGKVLIYERVDTRGHEKGKILSRDLATGEEKQLLEVNDIDHFSISPDSRWLALLDYPKEKVLRVMPLGGGEPKELLRFEEDRNFHSQVAWTADGKHIFFQRNEPAAPGETSRRPVWWWIPAQGGEPQKLTLGISGILLGLSAHPDGQRIAAFGYSRGPAPESPAVWVMENFLPTVNGSKQASR